MTMAFTSTMRVGMRENLLRHTRRTKDITMGIEMAMEMVKVMAREMEMAMGKMLSPEVYDKHDCIDHESK